MINQKSLTQNRVIPLYRYVSLFITSSLYYYIYDHTAYRKIIVITLLTIATVLFNFLYKGIQNSNNKTKALILIETIGNLLILIPSGGLASPYVWYSLNTVLIASIRLKQRYCWINLAFYVIVASLVTVYLGDNNFGTLKNQLNIIMALVLVTVLIIAYSELTKDLLIQKEKLSDTNAKLNDANREINNYLKFTMSLYECVEILASQCDMSCMERMIVDYAKAITGSNQAEYIANPFIDSDNSKFIDSALHDYIRENRVEIANKQIPELVVINDVEYVISMVKSQTKTYGLLYVRLESNTDIDNKVLLDKIKFLSTIIATGFENIEIGNLNEKLIAERERNKIALEIHDGVLQKLFGLSCYLYKVAQNTKNNKATNKDIVQLRESLNTVTKELRETIYGISSTKDGLNNFTEVLNSCIDQTKLLHKVDVNLSVSGDLELLSTNQKKAIYRIICESMSNSIRHGEATLIDLELKALPDNTYLKIIDNGKGFDYEKLSKDQMGLGLRNMTHLIYSINGTLDIKSKPGDGTKIVACL